MVGFERIGLTRSRERNFSQPRLPTWPMRAGEGGVVLVQGVGEDIAGDEFPAQFTTHFERPGRLYYLLASGRGALGARGVGGARREWGGARYLSLSHSFLVFSANLTDALPRLSPFIQPRALCVSHCRAGNPSPLFLSARLSFELVTTFFPFFFFFLSEVILCATNLPVGCVLGGVLCRYLSPPPARNYSVVSRIFIARTSLHFPGGEGKFPLCNFSSFLQFLSRESSRLDHVSLITRVSLSLSLYSSVAPHFFFFFAPIKARCLHFSISPRIFLHRYSYITL